MKKKGMIEYQPVPSKEDNSFDIEKFKEMIKGTKLVSMVHVSNLDGTQIPEKDVIEIAHDHGAIVMLDCAQSVPHMPIDMKDMDLDLLVFSGHKVCGPTGTGVLAGKMEIIEKLEPFIIGGDTVMETSYSDVYFLSPPKRFEAGLQNYSGFIGLGAALDYVEGVGIENIHEHEIYLNKYASELMKDLVTTFGSSDPEKRGGIFPFKVDGFNSHDISLMLDELAQIEVRSGRHCVHSWFNLRKVDSFARASFYLYNTKEEVKTMADTLRSIIEEFQ
jgi:cysteine desulfurase/selenocysteine lyase